MVCHCLLIESSDGLVLVDTGFGRGDVEHPRRLGAAFRAFTRPRLTYAETALAQIEARGFTARDVRHIVLTHLDLDHAGGLGDFPEARVHVMAAEHAAAMAPPTSAEKRRYRAAQWAHQPKWELHSADGERWHGFERARAVGDDDILMIPLAGHTRGHAAVAVRTNDGHLLHAGDAYFFHGELETPATCPTGLRAFQSIMAVDDTARRENQRRLRTLAAEASSDIRIVCAHDPAELTREQGRLARQAINALIAVPPSVTAIGRPEGVLKLFVASIPS